MLIPVVAVPSQTRAEPDRFDEFWSLYPKKADKAAAQRKWATARRRATQQVIIDGARRYRDDPHRDPGYTKNGATWLHADAWTNPPEPDRSARTAGPRNYAAERLAASVAIVSELRAEQPVNYQQIDPWATPAPRQIGTAR